VNGGCGWKGGREWRVVVGGDGEIRGFFFSFRRFPLLFAHCWVFGGGGVELSCWLLMRW
jgi:hypothetical protein